MRELIRSLLRERFVQIAASALLVNVLLAAAEFFLQDGWDDVVRWLAGCYTTVAAVLTIVDFVGFELLRMLTKVHRAASRIGK